MDILFLNRSYWPDVEATGQLLTELCTDLARNHRVMVIAGQPNFVSAPGKRPWLSRETHDGVEIIRVGNRTFDKRSLLSRARGLGGYFALTAWAAFRCRRPDVIVVETDPPLLPALGAVLKAWRRRPFLFYVQDLYPEVGLATGRLKPGLLTWLLYRATQMGLKAADRVVVLGEDMRRRILARGIDGGKMTIVPNWADASAIRPTEGPNPLRQEWGVGDRFVVMYSGNVGLAQNLGPLLEVAAELRGQPVLFVLIGEGAAKADLMDRAAALGLDNVRFLPYQPKETLGESLTAADVHLIPLRRGLAGYIVPSKLYGILAAGRPYIAAVEADSETAVVTEEARCGLRIEPDVAGPLAEAVHWCLANRGELTAMGRRGRQLSEMRFNRQHASAAFERLLDAISTHCRTLSLPKGSPSNPMLIRPPTEQMPPELNRPRST